MRDYECILILNANVTEQQQEDTISAFKEVLTKQKVELIDLKKTEQKKLPHEIKHIAQGVFYTGYFKSSPAAIAKIQHWCNLNNIILRNMIVKTENNAITSPVKGE